MKSIFLKLRCSTLNRESRESRERSRRCNPGSLSQRKPFQPSMPLSGLSRMGRLLKRQGSQKTCLNKYIGGLRENRCRHFVLNTEGLRKLGAALHVRKFVEGVFFGLPKSHLKRQVMD